MNSPPSRRRWRTVTAALAVVVVATLAMTGCGRKASDTQSDLGIVNCLNTSGSAIPIGSVNSLTGGLAASETVIHDAITMAVSEINSSGGVLGKQLRLVSEDGASDPTIFAQKAQKLISNDCVAAVFGGYLSLIHI